MGDGLVAQLLEAGLVTRGQVSASGFSENQPSLSAGAVALNLVEQGLDEEALAGFFVSRGFGPMLQARDLARADPTLTGRLSAESAHALCALPLRTSPAGVIVAMVDPTDLQSTTFLQRTLDDNVLPTVAKLSDLLDALDRIYVRHGESAVSDPLVLTRRRVATEAGRTSSQILPRPEPARSRPPVREANLEELAATASPVWDRAWNDRESRPAMEAVVTETESAQAELNRGLATLSRARSRDDLVRLGCEACLSVAKGSAFLALQKGVLRGWHGVGEDVAASSIRSLWVPAGNPSMLSDVLKTGEAVRGPYGHTAADHLFRAALGGRGREVAIAPVLVGERLCGLLCATDPVGPPDAIEHIAGAMGQAFERLIVSRKSRIS